MNAETGAIVLTAETGWGRKAAATSAAGADTSNEIAPEAGQSLDPGTENETETGADLDQAPTPEARLEAAADTVRGATLQWKELEEKEGGIPAAGPLRAPAETRRRRARAGATAAEAPSLAYQNPSPQDARRAAQSPLEQRARIEWSHPSS